MKKQYMNPSTECAMMNAVTILCVSSGPEHSPLIPTNNTTPVGSSADIG